MLESDEAIELGLLRYTLASSAHPENQAALCDCGLSSMLLHKLTSQTISLPHTLLIMQTFMNLARNRENHVRMLEDEGMLTTLTKHVFHEMANRKATRYLKDHTRTRARARACVCVCVWGVIWESGVALVPQ